MRFCDTHLRRIPKTCSRYQCIKFEKCTCKLLPNRLGVNELSPTIVHNLFVCGCCIVTPLTSSSGPTNEWWWSEYHCHSLHTKPWVGYKHTNENPSIIACNRNGLSPRWLVSICWFFLSTVLWQLLWRHIYERHGVSNRRQYGRLFNSLLKLTTKRAVKLRTIGREGIPHAKG